MYTRVLLIACLIFFLDDAFAIDECLVQKRLDPIVNVSDMGAIGDGFADDTDAFQRAFDKIASTGGTVEVGSGIYMINAVIGIKISSNTNLLMDGESYLTAFANKSDGYSIIKIADAENVSIVGGNLRGERYSHQSDGGEWGMGLSVLRSTDILIKELSSEDNWGDGFYIGGNSKNVKFCSVVANNNRRQGMSIISGENITVTGSVFRGTHGVNPQAGIDIEPNRGDSVRNVHIKNSKFINNSGAGIMAYVPIGGKASSASAIIIEDNILMKNGSHGIWISSATDVRIARNIFLENNINSIELNIKSNKVIVEQNTILNSARNNIAISDKGKNNIFNNSYR